MRTHVMLFNEFGGSDVLTSQHVVLPRSDGDVLIRVLATSVNHLDLDIRSGLSRMPINPPHVLGREIVGELLEDTAELSAGTRVLVLPNAPCGCCASCTSGRPNLCKNAYMPGITGWGGYAEHVAVPPRALVPIGELDAKLAATTPISFGTAWRMLFSTAKLSPGEWVLISGAAGGLGHAAVQLAHLAGARIVGLIGDPSKTEFVEQCGADAVISPRDPDWPELAREVTGGRGFDVIVEHIGGEVFTTVIGLACDGARVLVGGGHAGEHPGLDVITTFRKELRLLGVRSQRPDEIRTVLDLAAAGKIRPRIDRVLPLESASLAHDALTARTVRGKQVLVP